MQKKSKKQRKKEYLAQKEKLQKTEKVKAIPCQGSKEAQKTVKMEVILYQESTESKLDKIQRSELSEQEKLIQSLILLNPKKIKEGDVVIDEEMDVLYYGVRLNMEVFKNLSYPKGYGYRFSKYPKITFNLNGVERSVILRRA